jgi:hypothetical protein
MKIKNLLFISAILLLVSCADKTYVPVDAAQHIYGFWGGVWHGMIMVPDFIGSLIWDDVAIYAINNNGFWYDFGFVGGLGIVIRLLGNFLKAIANVFSNKL